MLHLILSCGFGGSSPVKKEEASQADDSRAHFWGQTKIRVEYFGGKKEKWFPLMLGHGPVVPLKLCSPPFQLIKQNYPGGKLHLHCACSAVGPAQKTEALRSRKEGGS